MTIAAQRARVEVQRVSADRSLLHCREGLIVVRTTGRLGSHPDPVVPELTAIGIAPDGLQPLGVDPLLHDHRLAVLDRDA
jgi:hypothetical protein